MSGAVRAGPPEKFAKKWFTFFFALILFWVVLQVSDIGNITHNYRYCTTTVVQVLEVKNKTPWTILFFPRQLPRFEEILLQFFGRNCLGKKIWDESLSYIHVDNLLLCVMISLSENRKTEDGKWKYKWKSISGGSTCNQSRRLFTFPPPKKRFHWTNLAG